MSESRRSRIMVMEPQVDGHHGPYVSWMIKGLADRGCRVDFVTMEKNQNDSSLIDITQYARNSRDGCINMLTPHFPELENRVAKAKNKLILSQLAYWQLFKEWYKSLVDSEEPDVVFLPYLDYCFYAIGLLGSPFGRSVWCGLPMRMTFHFQEVGIIAPKSSLSLINRALFFRVLKNCYLRNLLTFDESLYQFLTAYGLDRKKMVLLSEPLEFDHLPDSVIAKQELQLEPNRKILLVYGEITNRKGLEQLFRALSNSKFSRNVDVLLAGKISYDASRLLSEHVNQKLTNSGRIKIIDRFINYDEVGRLFAAADAIWLGYSEHYVSSALLVQAAGAGVPIIACEEGIIGWQTKRYGLGKVVKTLDEDAVINAVNDVCGNRLCKSIKAEPLVISVGSSKNKAIDALFQSLLG